MHRLWWLRHRRSTSMMLHSIQNRITRSRGDRLHHHYKAVVYGRLLDIRLLNVGRPVPSDKRLVRPVDCLGEEFQPTQPSREGVFQKATNAGPLGPDLSEHKNVPVPGLTSTSPSSRLHLPITFGK
jgi:hypothetical protein